MDEYIKRMSEKGVVIKAIMKADRRSYSFEVLEAKNGSKYIEITEKDRPDKDKFSTQKIRIFQEHIKEFTETLSEIVKEVYPFNDVLDIYPIIENEKPDNNSKKKSGLKRNPLSQNAAREGNFWSKEEEAQLLELNDRGCSIGEIAYKHERSKGAISSRLKKLEIIK